MSYAIAPTFEGNRLGQRDLRLLSGLGGVAHGLGDAGIDSYSQMLQASGYSADDINTLIAGGATTVDLGNLLNGVVTMDDLLHKLYPPSAPPPAPTPGTFPSTQSLVPTGLPAGMRWTYTVTYNQNISTPSPNAAIAQMVNKLPQYQMSVAASNLISNTYLGLGSATIQFTIVDNVGHAKQADIQSVLDSLMQQFTYNSVTGSNLSPASAPPISSGGGAVTPATSMVPASTLTAWFTQNWGWVLGIFAAMVIVPPLVKKL